MRTLTQTIRSFATLGLGQNQATAITLVGCGVRALAHALALYLAASSSEEKPNDPGRFADKRESSPIDGITGWQRAVVCLMRGISFFLRILRRFGLRMSAMLRDTLSPAGVPQAAHALG